MSLLMLLSVAGFMLSAFVHIRMLFYAYNPPRFFLLFINISAAILLYIAIYISKRVYNRTDVKAFRKMMFNVCPEWLKVVTGLLVIYALGGLFFYALKRYFGDSVPHDRESNIQGFTGHWMGLYMLAFSIVYSCKIYVKSNKDKKNI